MSTLIRTKLLRCVLLCCLLLGMGLAMVSVASANVRNPLPPGTLPIWARAFGSYGVVHDDEWAVIPFYYQPEEVPGDFNLLDLIDYSLFGRGLTPTVTGFEIWENGPGTSDVAPQMLILHGSGAVPVWFVPWEQWSAAAADNVLTMDELRALDRLEGSADFYKETLIPARVIDPLTTLQIQASGTLADGRSFRVQSISYNDNMTFKQNTRVVFR